jgi:hypothetical protein
MDPIEYVSTADDYAPFWRHVGRRLGHDAAKMSVLKREFLRALCVKDADEDGGMPAELDAVWHEVVLNTRAYATICERVCGHFVHHTTLSASDASVDRRSRVDSTVLRYRKRFREEPDEAVWQLQTDEQERDYLSVFVKQLNGKTTVCDGITCMTTVAQLKQIIEEKTGYPSDLQRLIYAGHVMDDDATCESYGMQHDDTVHLVMRMRAC